jgi:hypothetical protein
MKRDTENEPYLCSPWFSYSLVLWTSRYCFPSAFYTHCKLRLFMQPQIVWRFETVQCNPGRKVLVHLVSTDCSHVQGTTDMQRKYNYRNSGHYPSSCLLSESDSELHYNWQSVSQSVSLGVEPNLGLLTRDYFFFKLLSCHLGAPSLTRGRVCHLSVLVNTV